MKDSSIHVDDQQLQTLLFGDESDHAFQVTRDHVESCETCRARLEVLSGSGVFDLETREMLLGFLDQTTDYPAASATKPVLKTPTLQSPSHPELLGRLGRYEIEGVVGAGGMGVVYKGFDTELNRSVALKVLAQHLSHNGAARQRFAREARASAGVVHEHVVPIYNVETEGESLFLVMPFIAGESLQARVDREGALDPKVILRIGIQAAAGLQAAHEQGVVHRDVKPGNILLEGDVERALVTDFGLAQTVDDASLTQTGVVAGTPNYMSPEQATGRPTDPRSDLFSLGCVLYFMATGRPPFRAEKAMGVLNRVCNQPHTPVWQSRAEIPDDLSDIIDRLLEKKPAHRFASAQQVHQALQAALVRLQRPSPQRWSRMKRIARRHRRSIKAAAIGIAVLTALIALMLVYRPLSHWSAAQPAGSVSSSNGKKEFSLEVWQQASPNEAYQWNTSMSELEAAMDNLENTSQPEPWPSVWDTNINSINTQIDIIQNESISH